MSKQHRHTIKTWTSLLLCSTFWDICTPAPEQNIAWSSPHAKTVMKGIVVARIKTQKRRWVLLRKTIWNRSVEAEILNGVVSPGEFGFSVLGPSMIMVQHAFEISYW